MLPRVFIKPFKVYHLTRNYYSTLGHGMAIEDCEGKGLELYVEPPCSIFAMRGSQPMVNKI